MEEEVRQVTCTLEDEGGRRLVKTLYYMVTRDPTTNLLCWKLAPNQNIMVEERAYCLPNLKAVALGGGTGLPVVLSALKKLIFGANPRGDGVLAGKGGLTAIVTVADDGGSSGALRRELHILPPGDIRNCLLSLSQPSTMAELLSYRFQERGELCGHSLGNLLLAALAQMEGSFPRAVETLSQVLGVKGRVLPATLADIALKAELHDGRVVTGESQIARSGGRIKRIYLEPEDSEPLQQSIEELERADIIIIGPGSLYTSIIPVLLVRGMARTIAKAKALKVLIANLMTEPGETDDYTLKDHITAINDHVGPDLIDLVLINNSPVTDPLLTIYRREGAEPVAYDPAELKGLGLDWLEADLLSQGEKVRHDPDKLARCLGGLLRQRSLGV